MDTVVGGGSYEDAGQEVAVEGSRGWNWRREKERGGHVQSLSQSRSRWKSARKNNRWTGQQQQQNRRMSEPHYPPTEPQQRQLQRNSSKLIVYEWDPVYLLAATTTLTQGFDLVHNYNNSNHTLMVGGDLPLNHHFRQGPTTTTRIQEQQQQPPNNCCPSLFAPGTHSLLLQESSS